MRTKSLLCERCGQPAKWVCATCGETVCLDLDCVQEHQACEHERLGLAVCSECGKVESRVDMVEPEGYEDIYCESCFRAGVHDERISNEEMYRGRWAFHPGD